MTGMGTMINVAGVLIGGIIGSLFGKFLTERYQDAMIKVCGLCVIFIGISGALEKILTISDGKLVSGGTMMMIGSFTIGTLLGEWMNIEQRMEQFGEWLKAKTGNAKDNLFVEGFVTTSLTICIGAMAIVGSIQDGLLGDYSILAAKAVLDLIIVAIMTAAMGKGCIFSAIPVAILQGLVTILARFMEQVMTDAALHNLSLTGSMLIFCVGVNLFWGKTVKVANMLPTILVAAVWAFLPI